MYIEKFKYADRAPVMKTNVYEGYYYQSKSEARYAKYLDLLLEEGYIKSWKKQVLVELRVNDRFIANYYVDFEVEHNDGDIEYVEVKGQKTSEWMFKWRLFEALNRNSGKILTVIRG